jgi:hypothetical protein
MTTSVSVAVATRNAQADALARNLDAGFIKIYSGTVPATADTALAGNTLLGTLPLQPTSAPAASSGTLTFDTTGLTDSSIDASGIASFFRGIKTDGTTVVMQGQVGTSGFAMTLADTNLVATGTVTITSFTHTVN